MMKKKTKHNPVAIELRTTTFSKRVVRNKNKYNAKKERQLKFRGLDND